MDNGKKNVAKLNTKLVKSVRDLDVFKKAYAISLEIHKATLNFPKMEQYALGDQIRRASKSVCALTLGILIKLRQPAGLKAMKEFPKCSRN